MEFFLNKFYSLNKICCRFCLEYFNFYDISKHNLVHVKILHFITYQSFVHEYIKAKITEKYGYARLPLDTILTKILQKWVLMLQNVYFQS